MHENNNRSVRLNNRNHVYKYILRNGPISRSEIAAGVKLSSPTILTLTNELLEDGYIAEAGKMESIGGRRPQALYAVESLHYSIGINISDYAYSIALTNLSQQPITHILHKVPFSFSDTYFQELNLAILEFINELDIPLEKISGIGISLPYVVDATTEKIFITKDGAALDIRFSDISKYFSFPCLFINSAKAAAFAEAIPVGTKGNFFYLSLNANVGGAIVNNYDIQYTSHNTPGETLPHCINYGYNWKCGEIGHLIIHPHGKKCSCGKSGCANAYCSTNVLTQYSNNDIPLFREKLVNGEPEIKQVWDTYLDDLAIIIDNIHTVMDCHIIIGGMLTNLVSEYYSQLLVKLQKLAGSTEPISYIQQCSYPVAASAYGAALCIIDDLINRI